MLKVELLLAWRSWASAVAVVGHMPAAVVVAGIASSLAVGRTAAAHTAGTGRLAGRSHIAGTGCHILAARRIADILHRTAAGHSRIVGMADSAGTSWRRVESFVHLV